jgi:hypothetical protein
METVNAHLAAQFSLGRLTGADYATVYLGAVQSSMQQSVAFILGKQQADKQADLIDKQILTEVKKTLDVTSTTTVRDAQSVKDIAVKTAQITSMGKEDIVKDKQALDITSQTSVRNTQSTKDALLKDEQIIETQEKVDLIQSQDLDVQAKTVIATTQSTKDALLKTAQTTVATNSAATELKKALDVVSQTSVRNAQSAKDAALKDAQKDKAVSEKGVLDQKKITEFAQTQKSTLVTPDTNSIMGRQASLYAEQAKGFKWNADQKYLKTVLDAWAVNVASADGSGTGVYALNTAVVAGHLNVNALIEDSEPV